ncbi:hypothetical protein APSETT445_003939 [Aspergillus pseudonomiae]
MAAVQLIDGLSSLGSGKGQIQKTARVHVAITEQKALWGRRVNVSWVSSLPRSIIHDFLSGVELNPRLGKLWDLKLFQIGRVGMNSWVLV